MNGSHPPEDLNHPCTMFDGEPCSCCRKIVSLESQMLEGQRLVDEMADQHRKLKSEKNRTHSLINRRIPPEILSAIFLYCLDSPKELERPFRNEEQPEFSSLELGAICRAWRDIAWSTPGLWCQLYILLDSDGEIELEQVKIAQQWLGRSGDLPLTLYIGMYRYHSQSRRPSFDMFPHLVLEVFKHYSKRWQDLYLRIWVSWVSKLGMDVPATPLLRTLKLYPMGDLKTNHKLWQNIQISPRSLCFRPDHLDHVTLDLSSKLFRNFDIDYNNLINLEVSHLPWNDYIQILKSATQLTSFEIFGFWLQDPFSESDHVVHSKLQHFSIREDLHGNNTTQSLDNFMSVLRFPSLTELDYDVGFTRASRCHCPATFLGRMQQLNKLSIQLSGSLEGHKYIDILKSMPLLEHLYIMDRDSLRGTTWDPIKRANINHLSRPLLTHLAATYMNDATKNPTELKSFLPALRTFGYRTIFPDPPWMDILSVLGPLSEIGNIHRRPLSTLHIDFGYSAADLDVSILGRLWEAKKAGIDVFLKDDDWYEEGNDHILEDAMRCHGIEPW